MSGTEKDSRAARRAALLAAAIATALAIAGIGASGASAAPDCGGSAIQGGGFSLQELAQESLWGPGFSGAGGVCAGGRPAGQAELETAYYSPLPAAGVDWRDVISAAVFSASKTSW